MDLKEFCVTALAAVLWQTTVYYANFFLKLTEQVPDCLPPDSLHSFRKARQVDV